MPLLNFWKNAREDVLKMAIEQLVASAGDGDLLDGSTCSAELGQFLKVAPLERLFDYAHDCLEKSFSNGGFVLQDIVNEFGRRLVFEVENGLYRGTRGARRSCPHSAGPYVLFTTGGHPNAGGIDAAPSIQLCSGCFLPRVRLWSLSAKLSHLRPACLPGS
jgi:hypothetical protein